MQRLITARCGCPPTGAGYAGDVEVEIFNADAWTADPAGVLALLGDRYETLMANHLDQSSEMFR